MADNTIANAIKFLKGEEKSLPAAKTEGQVYFAYKNVGTAEKPSYTGAIYIDTPIGGTQNRIKMTANADIADKAFNDSAGLSIRDTYLSSLGYTDDGKQTILIKGSGNNQTRIALPIASTTKSGIVTTDAQSFGGTKTFTTINSTNLTVTGSNGFNYSGIETATESKARPVWFADSSGNGKPVINTNFTYNPATQTLSVANLSGTADKANKDNAGNDIRSTYISNITVNNDIMTITKGSGVTSTLNIKDKLYSGARMATKEDLDKFIEANVFKFGYIEPIEGYNGLEKNDGIILSASWKSNTSSAHQIFIDDSGYALRHRYRKGGNWSDWASILDSTNYNSYAPTKNGNGAYGTWDINILGNAASANKLNTNAGSATFPVYFSNGVPVACSTNLAVNITGNAASATLLATARKISLTGDAVGSATFNGGADISISTVTRQTCFVGSDSASSSGWYKVASQTMSGYGDSNIMFAVTSTFDNYYTGIFSLQIRSDNTLIRCPKAEWLVRSGFSADSIKIVISGMTWTMYVNRSVSQYGRIMFEVLTQSSINGKSSGLTMYNTYTKESVTPNATKTSSDGGTVNYANSAYNSTRWNNYEADIGTNNTTDTWLLVANNSKIQHRLSTSFASASHTHPYLPLSGGTMGGTSFITWDDSRNWDNNNNNVTFPVTRGGLRWYGQSDSIKLFSQETASDNLELVLQFEDDNSNGLSIRDYAGKQTARIAANGNITASSFIGNLNGNANTATALTSSAGSSTQPIYFSGGKPVVCTYTLNKSVPADAKFTDTNTWRPLGTTGDTACAGNDSRLSNARPASDVYAWAKASSKPSYSWDEITNKPSSFNPSSHTHPYLQLAGGNMKGTINFNGNTLACNFRSNDPDYCTGIMHQTNGNEALMFVAANAVTSFIFKCGQNPVGMTFTTWTGITPSMQIKKQSVYINSLIANNVTPGYNLYVNGTTRCNGTLGVGNGSSAEIDFFPSSASTIGARIKAYSDRIEFVFS